MARYIDADKLQPDMTVFLSVYSETPVKVYSQEYINKAISADVAPVVRCKDCRSYKLLNGSWRCSYHGVRIFDDKFYCACGKRKELDNG